MKCGKIQGMNPDEYRIRLEIDAFKASVKRFFKSLFIVFMVVFTLAVFITFIVMGFMGAVLGA